MNNPLISIIVPLYNNENFIQATLESIIGQTYPNIEIIVVDDGSTDSSAEKVKQLISFNKKIRLISKKNNGVSSARNSGIEAASGDYISFCDADDILTPDYIDYLLNNAIKYKADISISTGIFTNYSIGNVSNSGNERIHMVSQEDAIVKMLTYWYPIGCYCRLFKKELFLKGLRFIDGQKVGEGFTFNIKALLLSKNIVVGDRPIYCYRRDNDESCMTKFSIDRAHEAVNSIQIIKSLFPKPSIEIAEALLFAEWHTKGDMYNWMYISKERLNFPEESNEYLKAIKEGLVIARRLKLTRKELIRLILQTIHPNFMPFLQSIRKNIGL